MLFSIASWHNEDNYLADQLPPRGPRRAVYKLVQEPGTFVVTFPQAFHSGFSRLQLRRGANFAMPHWIEHAKLANERYRRIGRLAVLGHDRLIFTLALRLPARRRRSGVMLRDEPARGSPCAALYADGVRDISSVVAPPKNNTDVIDAAACDYDDKRICAACRNAALSSARRLQLQPDDGLLPPPRQPPCKCPPANVPSSGSPATSSTPSSTRSSAWRPGRRRQGRVAR
ncbi:hypothetical protein JL721_10989 [Aureococcus anophagefferens]|nr:hypothetical protein JL721_10989 [Aureococcus anophagefferens]